MNTAYNVLAWLIKCFVIYIALVSTGCGQASPKPSLCVSCDSILYCSETETPACVNVNIRNRI